MIYNCNIILTLINKINKMNKEKLVHQLFVGKVADVIGIEKTTELLKEAKEAINFTDNALQLPDELEPVLAKIEHVNDLGKSSWYEVVFNDGNWRSYQGSKTFEDGEKVVKWRYCKAII